MEVLLTIFAYIHMPLYLLISLYREKRFKECIYFRNLKKAGDKARNHKNLLKICKKNFVNKIFDDVSIFGQKTAKVKVDFKNL